MSSPARALAWIVELLRDLDVPFQVVGGLAARAYGADRPLVDLDFYVPTNRLGDVAASASPHLVRAPAHHADDDWDIIFMALEHNGCRIELGGADDARYFDRRADRWVDVDIDYDAAVEREVCGLTLPIMPLDELIAYKRALDRAVDRQDLAQISPEKIDS
jgi:hypothetical protein